jgi:hypothetical protein
MVVLTQMLDRILANCPKVPKSMGTGADLVCAMLRVFIEATVGRLIGILNMQQGGNSARIRM